MKSVAVTTWVVAVSLTVLACAACTPREIVVQGMSTVSMFGRQRKAQTSFLYSSTAIFYPDGVPQRMTELPPLGPAQLAAIRSDLERQLYLLEAELSRDAPLISAVMGRKLIKVGKLPLYLVHGNAPMAESLSDGSIVIDVRVVQAMYRGILLAAVGHPWDEQNESTSEQQQKRALATLIAAQKRYLSESPIPAVQSIREAHRVLREHPASEMSAAEDMLNQELEDYGALSMSTTASDEYDDALAFILAHELGHIALDHFRRLKAGEPRPALEEEADRFGALLVVLTRNREDHPDWLYPNSVPKVPYHVYRIANGGFCSEEITYMPTGHKVFFAYGYALAGFDTLGPAVAAAYPPLDERARATREVTDTAYYAISAAQTDIGTCDSNSKLRDAALKDPAAVATRRLNQIRWMLGKSPLEPMHAPDMRVDDATTVWHFELYNPRMYREVYAAFVRRMSGMRPTMRKGP